MRYFDNGNEYLNVDTDEKLYFISGKGFVPEAKGSNIVVDNALCALKSSGALFHNHLERNMGWILVLQACLSNPETWMRGLEFFYQ